MRSRVRTEVSSKQAAEKEWRDKVDALRRARLDELALRQLNSMLYVLSGYLRVAPKDVVLDAAHHSRVILVNGARQTGKSTQVQGLISARERPPYLTMDDLTTLRAARNIESCSSA